MNPLTLTWFPSLFIIQGLPGSGKSGLSLRKINTDDYQDMTSDNRLAIRLAASDAYQTNSILVTSIWPSLTLNRNPDLIVTFESFEDYHSWLLATRQDLVNMFPKDELQRWFDGYERLSDDNPNIRLIRLEKFHSLDDYVEEVEEMFLLHNPTFRLRR
jgi:hypothetical protein